MKVLLFVFPIALLVAYSQIAIKWRMLNMESIDIEQINLLARLLKYLADPVIVSAYLAALLASFVWLYIITKLPLVVAFPVYIGVTFILVIIGGRIFLSEGISLIKVVSIFLILTGITIGVRN